MYDGILLQSVEGLRESPFLARGVEIWEMLQGEKDQVCQGLLAEGPLVHDEVAGFQERDPSEESTSEIEWRHRGQLEARLRDLNDAQDRLIDGFYGYCADCGKQIETKRLAADPAVALCFSCRRNMEGDMTSNTL
jgi:RNA polymerase-binding transcription factor DksA